ncbi:MAG: ribbon-helix-helix domain-containing protein [Deltaproteobacteria bacterium]
MRKLDFKPARLTTYITADQLAALEALSIETGAPITVHVRRALDVYLAGLLSTPKRKKGA